jgi:ATP phosphoribosyltransferase
MEPQRLRLAVQKSGRLSDGSFELLKQCGLTISRGRDKLYGRAMELPIDVMLVRDDDIPAFVADGACDAGIVGSNVAEEDRLGSARVQPLEVVRRLGFARCKLALAAPSARAAEGFRGLDGARVATSYPRITERFFAGQGVHATTVLMNGSVEVAPRLKIADAVCDIVSTGATLEANGLKPLATVFESEAVLIAARASPDGLGAVFEALLKRIDGVLMSRDAKYVMMNAPRDRIDAISALLPGAASPTVLELAGRPDMVAIHAVCREDVFWSTLEQLKDNGASAILVLPIEKMMA